MKLSLGFSPCPNDTFIFDALVSGKIDTGEMEWDLHLEDVQTLNEWALEGRLDITKLSFPALFASQPQYQLLSAGAALGRGVGPLLVSRQPQTPDPAAIAPLRVALPGAHTTANLLFQFAYPGHLHQEHLLFSDIEDAVLNGQFDLGVLIHENRFTYAERGLHLVADLGTVWEQRMGVPIPLGAIACRTSLGNEMAVQITNWIRQSLDMAWQQYPQLSDFVTSHAQEMSEAVMRQHIELYVNPYTQDLGAQGMEAIDVLRQQAKASTR